MQKFSWYIDKFVLWLSSLLVILSDCRGFRFSHELTRSSLYVFPRSIDLHECETAISTGIEKIHSNYGNNTGPGPWVDMNVFSGVLSLLNTTRVRADSTIAALLLQSSKVEVVDIIKSKEYCLSLFSCPPYSRIPARRHGPGCVLVYKSLYGFGQMSTIVNSRVIQCDLIESKSLLANRPYELGNLSPSPLVMRTGGPERHYINNNSLPSLFLELAINAPLTNAFGDCDYTVSHSVKGQYEFINTSETIQVKNATQEEIDNLLEFRYENTLTTLTGSDDTVARTESSLQANTTLLSKHRSKYDVVKTLSTKIGGLDKQLNEVSRRVLSTRKLAPEVLQVLGLSHVRGILLYGPPGTGKTLIAREIAKLLNARTPKVVNGPEILDKYIGEAERNIRELFRDADEEWDRLGYRSDLHVIVLDEFDSIAKRRGVLAGDGSGVRDSVVNQLLSKIDGISERNNVLIIGLTNRKDLIDPALLRPGRFEVHIEIPVPSAEGREEILNILFRPWIEQRLITSEQALDWIPRLTASTSEWTGAELAGLLRSSASFAIERSVAHGRLDSRTEAGAVYDDNNIEKDLSVPSSNPVEMIDLKMTWNDFELGLIECSATRGSRSSSPWKIKLPTFGVRRLLKGVQGWLSNRLSG